LFVGFSPIHYISGYLPRYDAAFNRMAVSRVMFADSFHRARSILWGRFDQELTFQDGKDLFLMGIDMSQFSEQAFNYLRPNTKTTTQNISGSENEIQQLRLFQDFISRPGSGNSLPLRIFLHPAVSGSELAWSAARVDVWFYQMDLLSKEAASINGGREIPKSLKDIPVLYASIWNFYELDSVIKLDKPLDKRPNLFVNSKGPEGAGINPTSHFGIWMYEVSNDAPKGSGAGEDALYEFPELEKDAQQLIDWLCSNHHDFMRLNDFSEALSLLRWLRANNAELTMIEIDEQNRPAAKPDHVILSKGPCVRNR